MIIKNRRFLIQLFCAVAVVFVFTLLSLWVYFFERPVINQDFYYVLKPATSLGSLTNDLKTKANLKHPALFYFISRLRGVGGQLKAGEYFFSKGSTIGDILARIAQGLTFYHRFTVVDGWNINQVMNALNHNPYLDHQLSHLSDEQITKALGCPSHTLEGWLFPDTYRFTKGTTDLEVLSKAYQFMQENLLKEWEQRAPNLDYLNPYQVLIVASMVEKETNVDAERPVIAAIILKRLRSGMRLQIDSTVIYGLNKRYTGNLTHQDLHQDTAYNTYTRSGLPSTPIAMPSLSSIRAVLHPGDTSAFFFVSKGDGTHYFSKTLEEHSAAIDQYLSKGES